MTSTSFFNVSAFVVGVEQLAATYPAWWADYEDSNLDHPDAACDDDRLLESAPTPFAVGLLAGRLLTNVSISTR